VNLAESPGEGVQLKIVNNAGSMMTEFEVLRRVELIRSSSAAPFHKARQLLRLRRNLAKQAAAIEHAKAQLRLTDDQKASAALTRLAARTETLNDDVREAALRMLLADKGIGLFPS